MGKYILITGGELKNKGAQAMTFITVDQMKRRYPDKEVILLSNYDAKRPEEEKKKYSFKIMPFPAKFLFLQSKAVAKVYKSLKKDSYFKKFCDILKNTDALIDVSGYTYGSNWGTRHTFHFLLRIRMANAWGIPVYLMPQSFGPFDFTGKHAPLVDFMSKHDLKKVKVIMAREPEGKEGLEKNYKLKNVILAPDLVLQNKGIELSNVYTEIPEFSYPKAEKGSVAVIPNSKNIKYSDEATALSVYTTLIDALLKNGKTVYLIYHAIEDSAVCKKIKEEFYASEASVIYVPDELSCIEFERSVSCFDFIVASRFHSIVHSYKMSVPAVILGWSVKYAELSGAFDQGGYCFDIKSADDKEKMIEKVNYMCEHFAEESDKIKSKLSMIQSENVFDHIKL